MEWVLAGGVQGVTGKTKKRKTNDVDSGLVVVKRLRVSLKEKMKS